MSNNFSDIFMQVTGAAQTIAANEEIIPQQPEEKPLEQPQEEKQEFDVQAWKEEQQQIRNTVYDYLEEITSLLQAGEVDFLQYLNVQAHFMEYSVSNTLLILAQNANAQKIGSAKFWHEKGALLQKGARHIYILEKGTAYQKRDGSISTNYEPRKMYDISQTNVKVNTQPQTFDQRTLLTGLIKDYPGKMEIVADLSLPVVVKENQDILYREGMSFDEGFTWLSYIIGRMALTIEDTAKMNYKAWCISYLLCQKAGIPFQSAFFQENNSLLRADSPKAFRMELKEIRQTAVTLYDQIQSAADKEQQVTL